jgi:hypothetical protein
MEFERDPTTHKLIKSPETFLLIRVKEHHIPIERDLGKWIMDKRYAQYDAHDDYDKINRAIDYAIKYDSFKDIPPPIIAEVLSTEFRYYILSKQMFQHIVKRDQLNQNQNEN